MLAIVWQNEGVIGNDSDDFEEVYGAAVAPLARQIVHRAIDDWNAVITNFNYAGGGNTFNLTVAAEALINTEIRGQVQAVDMVYDALGAPTAGTIRLDNDGAGKGWFFDPTPTDDVEFTALGSPFAATFLDVSGQTTRREDFYRTAVHEIGHVLGLFDNTFDSRAAITGMFQTLFTDSTLSQVLQDPTGISSAALLRFKSTWALPQFGVTPTFIVGSHLYEGDLYGPNMDPSVAFVFDNGVQQVPLLTHPNDLLNRRQASPAGNLDPSDPTPRETARQFISDLDVKILADAYGYSVVLPSTLNTAHAMLDVWTGTLLVQGGARDNATGAGVNDTINLQRVIDGQGDNILVTVSYASNTYSERVPFAQVADIVIHGNGGSDAITVNANVTQPWQQVQYVVSSNQDALEVVTSVGGASITNGIVDLSAIIPGSQMTLRAAVREANAAGAARRIYVGRGRYDLTLTGTGGDAQGDLDITGNVTILGAGAGVSVINGASFRILDVANLGVLNISRVTLAVGHGTHNSDHRNGGAIRVQDGGQLHLDSSAVVGNETGSWGLGGGIYFGATASGSIESSVITVNYGDQQTGGLYLQAASAGTGGTVTLESTIIANNSDGEGTEYPDIFVGAGRTLNSLGNNRFTTALGFVRHGTDHLGPVDYVVTSVADTYDGSGDSVNMSLRDAIYLANTTAGTQEIWLPPWRFILTRERTALSNSPEIDVAQGDLDIASTLTIRGVTGFTSVAWRIGAAADAVFDLLGDYNGDGIISSDNGAVDSADHTIWQDTFGSTTDLRADGNDDGVVNQGDDAIWNANFGNTLALLGV